MVVVTFFNEAGLWDGVNLLWRRMLENWRTNVQETRIVYILVKTVYTV